MRFLSKNFILLFSFWYSFNDLVAAQTLSKAVLELPRLCVYHDDPSQYYPCVLNYIGLTSWSLYRCPNQATFDEESQQCLVKVPISDTFEQLTTFPSVEHAQFRRLASFIVATPVPNEDPDVTQQQLRRLVSLPPMADKLIESLASRKLNKRSEPEMMEPSAGILWSHGYPLMKLNSRPVAKPKLAISARSSHSFEPLEHPPPVSEDELRYKKICYFTNWAQYRLGPARFEPENIDPFLCTHIIYAFAYLDNRTLTITKLEDNDEDLYRRINRLKVQNPKLKTLIGVGGWNMKSYAFSAMVHNRDRRRNFIFDSINFLREYNFDGLEIDWEYPGMRGGRTDDKYYLTMLFQEFKEAASAQAMITGRSRLLLAAAVAANHEIVLQGYEIDKIAGILDFINIMTYDFHGAWQNYTGLNAPLYRRYNELDKDSMLNQDYGIGIWLKNGAPAHKLVLGVPLFARSFLLARPDQHELHSPTIGNGTEGPFTRSAGFLSYFEVCLLQTDPKWQKRLVPDGSESEYMFKDREWVSYDTIDNIRKRAAYVVANNLGGMFIWSLDMDDFSGAFCNNGTYPYVKNSLSLLPTNMPSYVEDIQ